MNEYKALAKLQLTLDVVYELNDSSVIEVLRRLDDSVREAIAVGLLTSGHDAKVMSHAPQAVLKWQATSVEPKITA